jgi:hypothetical protein
MRKKINPVSNLFRIISGKAGFCVLCSFIFVTIFGYFYWFGLYLLHFQEQQFLFVFSSDYVRPFFQKPGGLTELAGKFLSQFYYYPYAGPIIISSIITLTGFVLLRIGKKLQLPGSFSALFALIVCCLLLFMQTHYYHLMEYNLGFLFISLILLLFIRAKNRVYQYLFTALFPLFYFLVGANIFIFAGIFLIYNLSFQKGASRWLLPAISLILTGITVIGFKEFIFLQPLNQLVFFPLPIINDDKHKTALFILTIILVLYPLLAKLSVKFQKPNTRLAVSIFSMVVILATGFFVLKFYNAQTARVVKIEKLAFEEEWDSIIKLHENSPSQNLIGQYFYNIALSETDQLCDRLFFGRQDFSANSLILPWGNDHLNRGAYFYYAVGLINEAHRWAYESMVVNGKNPVNMKMLTKTNLINEEYLMAKKYTGILKKTLNYRKRATEYEKITETTSQIINFPDLEDKRKIKPEKDFFIQINSPQNNIPLLFDANPANRKAFEYEMAWLMLMKDIESVMSRLYRMKDLGYTKIPRHLEEATLIYFNSKGTLPDMGGLSISRETLNHFDQYVSTYKSFRQNRTAGQEKIHKNFGNTYMYYYHFK